MEFIVYISNYLLGNLKTEELPDIAVKILKKGYDTPSLRILAGLDSNPWDIDYYFKLTLKEMNIKFPNEKGAGLILIKYYIKQIINKEIDPIKGIEKIINEVIKKTSCFNGKDKKYAYDYIGFHNLYGLYYAYDDIVNPLVLSSYKSKEKETNKIKDKIIVESIKFIKDFEKIEDK